MEIYKTQNKVNGMLLLECKNDYGIFVAIPSASTKWVWCINLRFPDDYRWVSPQLRNHLGVNGEHTTLGQFLNAMRIFLKFEKQLVDEGHNGWVAQTQINNYKMIHFFDSLGAGAYKIENCQVWFGKTADMIKKGRLVSR